MRKLAIGILLAACGGSVDRGASVQDLDTGGKCVVLPARYVDPCAPSDSAWACAMGALIPDPTLSCEQLSPEQTSTVTLYCCEPR